MASAGDVRWCKVGQTVFRVRERGFTRDSSRISIDTSIRDTHVVEALEALHQGTWPSSRQTVPITCMGTTSTAEVETVSVTAGRGRAHLVTIDAAKRDVSSGFGNMSQMGYNGMSTADLTDLAIRVAFFGEANPLGQMHFLAEIDNPLPSVDLSRLDADSLAGVVEVLVTEALVVSGRVASVSKFRLGPARSGYPVEIGWVEPRRFGDQDPERRVTKGDLNL